MVAVLALENLVLLMVGPLVEAGVEPNVRLLDLLPFVQQSKELYVFKLYCEYSSLIILQLL